MKKALDYVSDYQLQSACKDAICIVPSSLRRRTVLEFIEHPSYYKFSCFGHGERSFYRAI